MATFYDEATNVVQATAKASPEDTNTGNIDGAILSDEWSSQKTSPLTFWMHTYPNGKENTNKKLKVPRSIMNEHVGINYRTIHNGYLKPGESVDFTKYDDYVRCMKANQDTIDYLKAKKDPTYENIIKYYKKFDSHGMARYKYQDFIYLKYYNQIPNNHMITLRRYAQPVPDHIFGLDIPIEQTNDENKFPKDFFALATAVTYMGEQTGNKLSDIMKFEYGAKWETKEAQVTQLQNSDGGLAAQMMQWGISQDTLRGTNKNIDVIGNLAVSATSQFIGKSVPEVHYSQHAYPQNAFLAQYGEEFYGDINSVCETSMRARGLTFSNNFSLVFEYSLKSLKCVNPRVAMMDILSNFLLLTGNYGSFWGGETIYYGAKSIAPQFGDPQLLRQGKYGQYLNSLASSVRSGVEAFKESHSKDGNFNLGQGIMDIIKGGLQGLLGNLLGGNIGVAGDAQAPPALLSGEPTGFWHLTIGNPLDPIAMMGNMKIEKTTVQFNDILGYDDFPTEIKFTIDISHGKPRDNSGIENMFNANKGRFYVLSKDINDSFNINFRDTRPTGFQRATTEGNQEFTNPNREDSSTGPFTTGKLKVIGSLLG